MSLNILFWQAHRILPFRAALILHRTVQLFIGSWGIRSNWLGNWHDRGPLISKVFSIIFPGLIVGLLNIQAVTDNTAGFIIVAYVASKCFTGSVEAALLTQNSVYKSLYGKRPSHIDSL
jgi:hypothetical protein